MKCATCQQPATVHIDLINVHLCRSCLEKVDARIAEINKAKDRPSCGATFLAWQILNPTAQTMADMPRVTALVQDALDESKREGQAIGWEKGMREAASLPLSVNLQGHRDDCCCQTCEYRGAILAKIDMRAIDARKDKCH